MLFFQYLMNYSILKNNKYGERNVFVLLQRDRQLTYHKRLISDVKPTASLSRLITQPHATKVTQITFNHQVTRERKKTMKAENIVKQNTKFGNRLMEISRKRSRTSSAHSQHSPLNMSFSRLQTLANIRHENQVMSCRVFQVKPFVPKANYYMEEFKRHTKDRERLSKLSKLNQEARQKMLDKCFSPSRNLSGARLKTDNSESALQLIKTIRDPALGITPRKTEQISRMVSALTRMNIKGVKQFKKLKLPNLQSF